MRDAYKKPKRVGVLLCLQLLCNDKPLKTHHAENQSRTFENIISL